MFNTIIAIKTTEDDDDHFELSCFRDVRSPLAFVCELFSTTRINQEFQLAILFKKQKVVIALGLFRSSSFISAWVDFAWSTTPSTLGELKHTSMLPTCYAF